LTRRASILVLSIANSRKWKPIIEQVTKVDADDLISLADTPQKSLTLMLLLDQLSRNTFRGSDYTFTVCDPLARAIAEHSIFKSGHDKHHPPYKRVWYYFPFEHSENLHHQELAVWKFAELAYECREGEWKNAHDFIKMGLSYAWSHLRVIDKFGRFPARNKAMGRESTEEEEKFLVDTDGRGLYS
jgi:uncharacterized protein (DUF924 family)